MAKEISAQSHGLKSSPIFYCGSKNGARRKVLKFARLLGRVVLGTLSAALLVVLSYVVLVAHAWFADRRSSLPEPLAGQSDFSRLTHVQPAATIIPDRDPAKAIDQLRDLVRRTASQHGRITIAGSRHSMGGHTLFDGSLCIDMRCDAFRRIDPVTSRDSIPIVHVGAGATWHEVLTALDREGWSVAVMQSNDDFTVGGSISVNCHGWQPNSPPIASTIEAFRILLSDGSVRECRRGRTEDRELFGAVCGGYGLLGVILDVDLRIVPNALYRAEEFPATSANYMKRFESLVTKSTDAVGLAYGRISIAPGPWFLRDARIIRFIAASGNVPAEIANTLDNPALQLAPASWRTNLAGAVFRASAGSDFGKLGRWTIERVHGQPHRVVSRNGILRTPSEWFANRDPKFTEILHEYFVPPNKLAEFLDRIRPILRKNGGTDLLNVTLRPVERDDDTILAYARQDEIGLVMLFRFLATSAADAQMRAITERLIDAALTCDGSYYLPYRPHATVEQFRRAYLRCGEFYQLKRKYDPTALFENSFYRDYIEAAAK
jgi:FAD/FMN-containing dehydrogenase